ncbi:hypothetical protein [Sporosarcina sp. FSL K6-3457]|uniref:hypothetical protein n=1 Tax=Sporosarcina sp. FSL K6-3457 TaxID=2978204 RepID=UPI0030F52A28
MDKITLNQTHLSDLFLLPIGKKVRYIREILLKEYGNDFSGKSVANRVQIIVPSTLALIEKGKTKDIPSQALFAISKDFGLDINMFFDDFYTNNNYSEVTFTPKIFLEEQKVYAEQNEHKRKSKMDSNPLLETTFQVKVIVSKIASNSDEQLCFMTKSKEKYGDNELVTLLSQIISQTNSLDVSNNKDLIEEIRTSMPLDLAYDFLMHSKNSLAGFPWYSYESKLNSDSQGFTDARIYTEMLQKELKKIKEE